MTWIKENLQNIIEFVNALGSSKVKTSIAINYIYLDTVILIIDFQDEKNKK